MARERLPAWCKRMLTAVGLLLGIPGLLAFVSLTARPLHPKPLAVKQDYRVETLQSPAKNPLLFRPGTAYGYWSYGWMLVGRALEAAANQPFLRFIREQIFARLGMRELIPDLTAHSADGDFSLASLIGELISDLRVAVDTTTDAMPSGWYVKVFNDASGGASDDGAR